MTDKAINQRIKKIALLHPLGSGNHGDNACLNAIMRNITSRWPGATIFGITNDPADTQKRHGIPSYAIRYQTWTAGNSLKNSRVSLKEKLKLSALRYSLIFRLLRAISAVAIKAPRTLVKESVFLPKSFCIIKSLDLLVICRGGQTIEEMWKPQSFPFAVFKWALLARMAGVKCIALNVSADTNSRILSNYLFRGTLLLADYVAFRDLASKALALSLGFNGKPYEFPDSTYSLEIPVSKSDEIAKRKGAIVGVAPMSFGGKKRALYNGFIQQLYQFSSWLVRNHYCLTFFCTDISTDPAAIEVLETAFKTRNHAVGDIPVDSVHRVHQWSHTELLSNMSGMDYVITCRYYGVVLAHLLNIPVIAISHNPQVRLLMNDLGLSRYCLDVQECDVNALKAAFARLVSDREEIKSCMAKRLEYYQGQLSTQFDELFARELPSNEVPAGFPIPISDEPKAVPIWPR